MRLESGPPTSSGGNWIILVAMLAALGAVIGAIMELNRDGEKYAEPFVQQDALRIVIESELAGTIDAWLHEYASEQKLDLERVYRSGERLEQCLTSGESEGQALDAFMLRSEQTPKGWEQLIEFSSDAGPSIWYARRESSGRKATLRQLEGALAQVEGWASETVERD